MIRTNFKKINKSKPGPKGLFEESMISEVFQLARFGLTNKEIAAFYNIGISTFEGYQRKFPEFNQALLQGRMVDSLKVVASIHKQALGYEVQETEISEHLTKWGDVVKLKKVTTKHIQPSVTAAIYILKTRHGDKWMDIIKTESTQNYNINTKIDLTGISSEELIMLEKLGMKITTNKLGQKQLAETVGEN